MGALVDLANALTVTSQPSRAITKAPTTAPSNRPYAGSAYITAWNGRVPVANSGVYRHWAKHSEWVRGAINIRRSQVSSADWDIVPFDQRKPYSKRLRQQIRNLFMTPNPANDSFRTYIEPVIEDLIVLDAGCIEKVRNSRGELLELWPTDGAEIRVNGYWDGDPLENRYFWYPDNQLAASWKNRDFIYMMANRMTSSPIGFSPLETLKLTIEAELNAHEYNRRQVEGAAPDGLLHLGEGVPPEDVDAFRTFFETEVAGRGTLAIMGGGKQPAWLPFRDSNRDMQFLEWQIYLVRKIAVVLGLTPQDLGVTFDINRSTAETQIQISEDRGLRPLMSLIQEYQTEEIVWDEAFGGQDNNLAFRFTALNLKESTAKAEIAKIALANVPWRTVNEVRLAEGREPVVDGDKLIMATSLGAVDLSDVPTVREVIEMQTAKNQAPPPGGASSKDIVPVINVAMADPKVVRRDVSFERLAVSPVPAKVENLTYDDGTTKTVRTEYVIEDGLITGKKEAEVRDDDQ